jgi:hypothetical protein
MLEMRALKFFSRRALTVRVDTVIANWAETEAEKVRFALIS